MKPTLKPITNEALFLFISAACLLISCNEVVDEQESVFAPFTVTPNAEELPVEKNTPTVSFADAEAFMQNRCNSINQTLVRKMRTRFDGTTVYLFMSVSEDGTVCVSSVSEYALEVLAADCGSLETKLEEWNSITQY